MLRLFLLSIPLLLTLTNIDSPTHHQIPILLPTTLRLLLIICFIQILPFPDILRVSLTNLFLNYILQQSFFFALALRYVIFFTRLVHMCYAPGVRVLGG